MAPELAVLSLRLVGQGFIRKPGGQASAGWQKGVRHSGNRGLLRISKLGDVGQEVGEGEGSLHSGRTASVGSTSMNGYKAVFRLRSVTS